MIDKIGRPLSGPRTHGKQAFGSGLLKKAAPPLFAGQPEKPQKPSPKTSLYLPLLAAIALLGGLMASQTREKAQNHSQVTTNSLAMTAATNTSASALLITNTASGTSKTNNEPANLEEAKQIITRLQQQLDVVRQENTNLVEKLAEAQDDFDTFLWDSVWDFMERLKGPITVVEKKHNPQGITKGAVFTVAGDANHQYELYIDTRRQVYSVGPVKPSRPFRAPYSWPGLELRLDPEDPTYHGKGFVYQVPQEWTDPSFPLQNKLHFFEGHNADQVETVTAFFRQLESKVLGAQP